MTDRPITPPPELVQQVKQWEEDWHHSKVKHIELELYIAAQAAAWGYQQAIKELEDYLLKTTGLQMKTVTELAQEIADQELEACCEWLRQEYGYDVDLALKLRADRRPKPPSLKEQALAVLEEAPGPDYPRAMTVLNADQHALIRRALEALPND